MKQMSNLLDFQFISDNQHLTARKSRLNFTATRSLQLTQSPSHDSDYLLLSWEGSRFHTRTHTLGLPISTHELINSDENISRSRPGVHDSAGCIIHPLKLGTAVVRLHTINRDKIIKNLPCVKNMKNWIIPQKRNSQGNVQNQYFMLLTVPVLYYKPIQEMALKINRGTKKEDGREGGEMTGTGEEWGRWRGGGAKDLRVQKHFPSCLKALFCFPDAVLKPAEKLW